MSSKEIYTLAGFVLICVLVGIFIRFIDSYPVFSRELRYLKCEIRRSHGSERRYWKRRKRRLWWSILPFIKY